MKVRRGFTLVELMIVVAIIGILTAVMVAGLRRRGPDEELSSTLLEFQTQLQGLRAKALAEQRDHVFVVVNGDGTGCTTFNSAGCARWFILADPAPAWTLATFNPSTPGTGTGEVVERAQLSHVLLNNRAAIVGRPGVAPFGDVTVLDPRYRAACGAADCVGFRFRSNGEVVGELAAGGTQGRGHAVAFATDLTLEAGRSAGSILLVGFPNGIIKTYPY